ncbi:hypothetical protein, partial [Rubripirellula obstinata]|uniref:hypothetical protein n=1 Tax=Rubripirellula obstinata TaxID=406547 RepID=UPI001EE3E21A
GTHQASWSSRYSIKIRSFIKPKPGTNLSPKENHVNTKDLAAQAMPTRLNDLGSRKAIETAALGQVCRVVLNLHETITRY